MYTEGEWHPVEYAGYWRLNDEPFYEGGDLLNVEDYDNAEANAKLAAAAPDLLKALKSLSLSVMAHPDYTGEENDEWTDLIETADNAIKKATE